MLLCAICVFIVWLIIGFFIFVDKAMDYCPDYAPVRRWFCIFVPSFFKKWFNYRYIIKEDKIPCFSAKQIIAFEKTAPSKWKIEKNTDATFRPWEIYYYPDKSGSLSLIGVKTIFDYWKVVFYLRNRDKICEKNSDSLEYDKNTVVLLNYFQKDAENASKEAEKMMTEKEQEITSILNRLQKHSQKRSY